MKKINIFILILFTNLSFGQDNLLTNIGFESNMLNWKLTVFSGSNATMTRSTSESYLGGASLQITVPTANNNQSSVQLRSDGNNLFSLEQGKTYTLKFWAKSNVPITNGLRIAVAQNSPFKNIGGTMDVSTSTTWTEYVHTFTSDDNYSQARIHIPMGGSAGTYYFDSFDLREAITMNLALNKTATQSGTTNNKGPSLAVDGNTSGINADGSVSAAVAANSSARAWWQVDLGEVANISDINVYNRTDCCSNRLDDYHIFVSDAPFTSNTFAGIQEQSGVGDFHQTTQAGSPTTVAINRRGRYIRIQLSDSNTVLNLAEVEVFGTPLVTNSNLALNKTATQSGTTNNKGPSLAVDGNTSGINADGSVSAAVAVNSSARAWWQVDLGEVANISDINVYNRTDCCSDRLDDYHIFVSDVPFTSDTFAGIQAQSGVGDFHQTTQAGSPTTVAINRRGRYIRIQLSDINTVLNLAEVEVFGNFGPEPVIADFTSNTANVLKGNSISFSDASQNATSWLWTFEGGNPATSTDQNPVVTYATAGTYDVTLYVTNAVSSDILVKSDNVTIREIGQPGTIQNLVDTASSGGTIVVNGGTYRETVTIDKPITLKAASGERVVVDGRNELSGLNWSIDNNNVWSVTVSNTVLQQAFTSNEALVFDGDYPFIEARWPNMKFHENWIENKKWAVMTNGSSAGIAISSGVASLGFSLAGGYLHSKYTNNTFASNLITSHASGGTNMIYDPKEIGWGDYTNNSYKTGKGDWDRRFYVTGLLELLDVAEEWFYAEDTNKLYIKTPGNVNPSSLDLSVKVRDVGLFSNNTNNITVEGLEIIATSIKLGTDDTDFCTNLVIKDCKILYPNHNRIVDVTPRYTASGLVRTNFFTSENAPYISANQALIENVEIGWAANRGLHVNGKGNEINNTVIHNTSLNGIMNQSGLTMSVGGGTAFVAGANKLEHSTVYNSGGLSVYQLGLGLGEVNYNHIFNSGLYAGDISAWYMPIGSSAQGSVLSYNWVHATNGRPYRVDIRGNGLTVHHNVSWNNNSGTKFQGPGPWYMYNNTFFDSNSSFTLALTTAELTALGISYVNGASYAYIILDDSFIKNNLSYQLYLRSFNNTPQYIFDFDENAQVAKNDDRIGNGNFFVNTNLASIDLRPKSNSLAIDAGLPVTGITDDATAGSYVTDGSPDLGAYEFGGDYWYPGADWLNDGLVVPTTMAEATFLASSLVNVNLSSKTKVNYKEEQVIEEKTIISKIKVFPNPTTGLVNIKLPEDLHIDAIELIDILGRVVLVESGLNDVTNHKLNLADFNEGFYFIKTYTNLGEVSTYRLLIRK